MLAEAKEKGKYTVTVINRCSFILPAFNIKLFFVYSILITMVEAMILLWYCAAYFKPYETECAVLENIHTENS